MHDHMTNGEDAKLLLKTLEGCIENKDLVVVTDYGHGMLTSESISMLCDKSPFLAMNVQSNAGNRGFNPVSKYKTADYVCLQQHELSLIHI